MEWFSISLSVGSTVAWVWSKRLVEQASQVNTSRVWTVPGTLDMARLQNQGFRPMGRGKRAAGTAADPKSNDASRFKVERSHHV